LRWFVGGRVQRFQEQRLAEKGVVVNLISKAQICARQQKPMLTKPNVTETMLDDFQSFFLCASICVVDVGRPNLDHEASVGAANDPAAEVQ
jgi:hypothetical protein